MSEQIRNGVEGMKVVAVNHPQSTYPDALEAVIITLAEQNFRLHSSSFLPGQIQGTGQLMLFFEERPKFNVVPLRRGKDEER